MTCPPQHECFQPPRLTVTQHSLSTQHVWEQLGERLRRFFRARVADEATTDDLVQEAFLRIHRSLQQLTDEDRLAPWVFRIAKSLMVDHYRAVGREANVNAEHSLATVDELESTSDDPADEVDCNAQIAAWLPAAIELLPKTYREAVRLFELESLAQQEIATRLGLTLTAVKSRVRRGRAALATVVDECCVFELDRRGNILDYQRRGSCCPPRSCSDG